MRAPPDKTESPAPLATAGASRKSNLLPSRINGTKNSPHRRHSQARVIAEVEWLKLISRRPHPLPTEGWR
jgi:hypothetical protein